MKNELKIAFITALMLSIGMGGVAAGLWISTQIYLLIGGWIGATIAILIDFAMAVLVFSFIFKVITRFDV